MPVVYLVRHGQASFGAADYDVLSDAGREQSRVVAAELARRGLRAPVVACGSLARQRDTADAVTAALAPGGTPAVDPRWDEYDHLGLIDRYLGDGAAEGLESGRVQPLLDRALERWIGEGEQGGWSRFAGGATAALADLVARLGPGRDAVVVSSGGVIAAVCGALLDAPATGVVALNRVMVNAGITALVVGGSGTNLLSFNDHAHFAGERRDLLTYR